MSVLVAFVSFVPIQLVKKISRQHKLTEARIFKPIQRSGFKLRFGDVREYFATCMTKCLNAAEKDFLQGRVSGSVFMRNYFNPALIGELKERTSKE